MSESNYSLYDGGESDEPPDENCLEFCCAGERPD